MKALSTLAQTVTPSPIRQMFNRALGMEDVVSFTVGESDFTTPEHVVEAAVEALRAGEHKYTPNAGVLPLRQAICRTTEKSYGLSYDPETQTIVTAAGMEALMLSMLTIIEPGDEWILGDPCWTNYSRQVNIAGGMPKFVSVRAEDNFHFDPTALEKAMTGWRVGYALGPVEIIKNMVKLQENVTACVDSVAQYAAIAALEGTQEPLHQMVESYSCRR